MVDSFHVPMDTKDYHAMLVHYIKNKAYQFNECEKGLYYLNFSNPETIPLTTESGVANYSFLSSANENMDYITCADI